MRINPANVVTLLRVAMVTYAIFLRLETTASDTLVASILALAMVLDAVDGQIARLFGFADEVGKLTDLYADHMVANAIWVTLAYEGVVSVWIPLIATSRDMAVDLFRQTVAVRTGLNGFDQVASSKLGWLSASRGMRFFYGALKLSVWALALESKSFPMPYAVYVLGWFTVAICAVRAIPAFCVGLPHVLFARR